MVNNPLSTYQQAQISGLSQRDLIVMCYKGAIGFLKEAKVKLEEGDAEAFSISIEKAHRIIFHLYTSLDMAQGGEIAQRLGDLYSFLINQIYLLNATKKIDIADSIIKIMSTLKEGWEGLNGNAVDIPDVRKPQPKTTAQVVSVQI
jgi:flagellar protein FliS